VFAGNGGPEADERIVNWKDAPVMGTMATTAAAASSSNPTILIVIVVVFVGFYFLMIRPQRQRQQRIQQQQNAVTPGARVRTTAGMYATVVAVDGDDVVLEVAPGVEVRYMKRAVMDVVGEGEPPVDAAADYNAEDSQADSRDGEDAESSAGEWDDDTDDSWDHAQDSDDAEETDSTKAETGGTKKD
jgi:preprotein translocase subunit YajC